MESLELPEPRPALLASEHLHLVAPSIRPIVEEAWRNGEDVPFGAVYVSARQLTPDEIEFGKKLWSERSANGNVQEAAILATGAAEG